LGRGTNEKTREKAKGRADKAVFCKHKGNIKVSEIAV